MKLKKVFAGMTAVLLVGLNLNLIPASATDSYRDVLYSVLNTQKYGDVQFSVMEGSTKVENNSFAICDINGDGIRELLIKWDDTYMAGMEEAVFSKDAQGNVFCKGELGVINDYYDNGVIKSYASHNQTPSSFWPYGLMRYNPTTQKYELIASVSAWDKSIESTYEGKTFPDWADTSGTGTVYYITPVGGNYTDTAPVDVTDYNAWFQEYTEDASAQIVPEYWHLTATNIDYVCNLLETTTPTAQNTVSGDNNHDGRVDATDAAYILQYSAEVGAGNFTGTLEEYVNAMK